MIKKRLSMGQTLFIIKSFNKTGIFKPYYNIQIDGSDEYILHYGVYPNPIDTKTRIPFLNTFYYRYGFHPKKPVADVEYGSYDNYMYNLEHKMSLTMKYHTFTKENENKFKKQKYNIKNLKTTHDQLISEDDSKKPLNLTQSTQEYYDEAKKEYEQKLRLC